MSVPKQDRTWRMCMHIKGINNIFKVGKCYYDFYETQKWEAYTVSSKVCDSIFQFLTIFWFTSKSKDNHSFNLRHGFEVVRVAKLERCSFMPTIIVLLSYIMLNDNVKVDPTKVNATKSLLVPCHTYLKANSSLIKILVYSLWTLKKLKRHLRLRKKSCLRGLKITFVCNFVFYQGRFIVQENIFVEEINSWHVDLISSCRFSLI